MRVRVQAESLIASCKVRRECIGFEPRSHAVGETPPLPTERIEKNANGLIKLISRFHAMNALEVLELPRRKRLSHLWLAIALRVAIEPLTPGGEALEQHHERVEPAHGGGLRETRLPERVERLEHKHHRGRGLVGPAERYVVHVGMPDGKIAEITDHGIEPGPPTTAPNSGGDLAQRVLGDGIENGISIGEVVVHGHGHHAELGPEPAHGERRRAVGIDEGTGRLEHPFRIECVSGGLCGGHFLHQAIVACHGTMYGVHLQRTHV